MSVFDELLAAPAGEPKALLHSCGAGRDLLFRVPVETLERMLDLYERVDERRAGKELADAIARFQGLVGPIPHDSEADYATRGGSGVKYTYASLSRIAETIRDALAECGLSYFWTETRVADGWVRLENVVQHVGGGERRAGVAFPLDDRENKALSPAQKVKAVITFSQRVSLIQNLGLTTADSDTDAARTRQERQDAEGGGLTAEQVKVLKDLAEKVPKSDRDSVVRWAKAESIETVAPSKFENVKAALEGRIEAIRVARAKKARRDS